MSENNIFTDFQFEYIEQYIKFINFLNELCNKNKTNQWIMVIWNLNGNLQNQSICVLNEEHLTLFMNWLIENQEFVWNDEKIKTGVDILQELKFIFNSNPISLHQYFMKYKQNNKSILNPYTFLNFIEEISEQRYELNKEDNSDDDMNENDNEENEENDIYNDTLDTNEDDILSKMNYDIDEINKFVNIIQLKN